jgi:hypothetical protein
VKAALEYYEHPPITSNVDAIHEPMFLSDASRPLAFELIAKRFWFANAFKWMAQRVLDEIVYAADHSRVCLLPIKILSPAIGLPPKT